MAVQDAVTFSVAEETVAFGTPKAPDHPLETLGSSKFTWNINRLQGAGMRVGGQFARSGRRADANAWGSGTIDLEPLSKGQGLHLKLLMGAVTTTLVAGSTYQNLYTRPTTVLPSATIQKAIQQVDGTVKPETYFGCTCTDWELAFDNNALLSLKSNWDAVNMSTAPANISTTLSALCVAGATSVSSTATVPVGAAITLNALETRVVTGVSGAGPYTLTFAQPLANGYASAAPVVVIGYTAPTYSAGGNLFSFAGATLYSGTVTAPTTTALASAVTPIANVRSGSISVNNSLLDGRYLAGNAARKSQQKPGAPVGTVKLVFEYTDTAQRDAILYDTASTLVANFTAGSLSTGLETLQVVISEMKPQPGELADSDGKDVPTIEVTFDILDNLTATQAIWIVTRTSDVTV